MQLFTDSLLGGYQRFVLPNARTHTHTHTQNDGGIEVEHCGLCEFAIYFVAATRYRPEGWEFHVNGDSGDRREL